MDDLFDHEELLGDMHSGGRPFQSREELEAENERLREENEMLAELLTGQFEEGSGEIPGGGGEGANPAEDRPRFAISDAAIELFEALPEAFTLDEALDQAERLGQPSIEVVNSLRSFLAERMVVQEEEQFVKTGRKPYF